MPWATSMAAGLEVKREQFGAFQMAFMESCAVDLKDRDLTPSLAVDGWVTLPEVLDPAFMEVTGKVGPFGEGNPEPVWAVRGVQVVGVPREVGAKHLKFRVGSGPRTCEAIGFNMAGRLSDFPQGPLDVAFMLRTNTYQGRT